MKTKRTAREIALCGLMAAVILLFLAADLLLPTATLGWAALAGTVLFLLSVEYGTPTACVVYVSTAVLCGILLLSVRPNVAALYILPFGIYGILKRPIDTFVRPVVLRWTVKVAAALFLGGGYVVCCFFLFNGGEWNETVNRLPYPWFPAVLAVGTVAGFVLYDLMLIRLAGLYLSSLRRKLFSNSENRL